MTAAKLNIEEQTSSTMRFLNGEEVNVCLGWDERFFYAWLEPTAAFEDFCERHELIDQIEELRADIDHIGVQKFGSLDSVNEFCKRYCGDNEPASFAYTEDDWVMGVNW